MKFKDLYERGLDRKVNPAVSASDLSEETVHTEIEEYVFTQEIIVNLYNILTNIRLNQGSHVGIWINGYYGSGKSHFLKYASYCLSGKYSKKAFERLIGATQQMLLGDKDISALEIAGVSLSDLRDLQNWYENKADVEMVMFNIGDVHDANVDRANTFTTIFWNQFNAKRGYNSFNLPMAQYLEKALDDDGKFGEFKEYVKGKGYDWERNISRFAASKLDLALQTADKLWLMSPQKGMYCGLPEDLVLSGAFQEVFASQSFFFNPANGNFSVSYDTYKPVHVYGDKMRVYWTVRALARLGYCGEEKADTSVEVSAGKWILNHSKVCSSIEELSHELSLLKFKTE